MPKQKNPKNNTENTHRRGKKCPCGIVVSMHCFAQALPQKGSRAAEHNIKY